MGYGLYRKLYEDRSVVLYGYSCDSDDYDGRILLKKDIARDSIEEGYWLLPSAGDANHRFAYKFIGKFVLQWAGGTEFPDSHMIACG